MTIVAVVLINLHYMAKRKLWAVVWVMCGKEGVCAQLKIVCKAKETSLYNAAFPLHGMARLHLTGLPFLLLFAISKGCG